MSWQIQLDELAKSIDGTILSRVSQVFQGVSTDSRKSNANLIFFALKGENFDAHNFLEQARDSGAAVLVVHKDVKIDNVSVIKVSDTLMALQKLGHYWRMKMKAKIVGITGTNGKTTTKDFAATIISTRYKTVQTKGSLNNFIGLPLSLLSMDDSTQVGIFEMGMSVPGEIATLAKIAVPDVALVTTVGRAHLEGMGSVETIAENKAHMYQFAKLDAVCVLNLDNPYTKKNEIYFSKRKPRDQLFK
jgi:UDP-N-acetylmuramoyl-tripeptide--D-alanyl-D-alanine ligase